MKIIYKIVGAIFLCLICLAIVAIFIDTKNDNSNNGNFDFFLNPIRNIFETHDDFSIEKHALIECTTITANSKLEFNVGDKFKYKIYYKDFDKPSVYSYTVTGIENRDSGKYYIINISEEDISYKRIVTKEPFQQKTEKVNISIVVLNTSILISDEGKILKKDTNKDVSANQCESFINGMISEYDMIDIISPWMLALNNSFIMNIKYKVLYEHNGIEGVSELNDKIKVIGMDKVYGRECFVVEKVYESLVDPEDKWEYRHLLWIDKEKRILLKGESYYYDGNLTSKIELLVSESDLVS